MNGSQPNSAEAMEQDLNKQLQEIKQTKNRIEKIKKTFKAIKNMGKKVKKVKDAIRFLIQVIKMIWAVCPEIILIALGIIICGLIIFVLVSSLKSLFGWEKWAELKNSIIHNEETLQENIDSSYIVQAASMPAEQYYATIYENIYLQIQDAFKVARDSVDQEIVKIDKNENLLNALYGTKDSDEIMDKCNNLISSVYKFRNNDTKGKYEYINQLIKGKGINRTYDITSDPKEDPKEICADRTSELTDTYKFNFDMAHWICWAALSTENQDIFRTMRNNFLNDKNQLTRKDLEYMLTGKYGRSNKKDAWYPIETAGDYPNASVSYYQPVNLESLSMASTVQKKAIAAFYTTTELFNENPDAAIANSRPFYSYAAKSSRKKLVLAGKRIYNGEEYPVYIIDPNESSKEWPYKSGSLLLKLDLNGEIKNQDQTLYADSFALIDIDLTLAANMSWYFESLTGKEYKRYSLFDNYMNYLVAASMVATCEKTPPTGWINFINKSIGLIGQNSWFTNIIQAVTGTDDNASATNLDVDKWSAKQWWRNTMLPSGQTHYLFVGVQGVSVSLDKQTEIAADGTETIRKDLDNINLCIANTDIGDLVLLPKTVEEFEYYDESNPKTKTKKIKFLLSYFVVNNSIDLDRLLWSLFTSSAALATSNTFTKTSGLKDVDSTGKSAIDQTSVYGKGGSFYTMYQIFEPTNASSSFTWWGAVSAFFKKELKEYLINCFFVGKYAGDAEEVQYYIWGLPLELDDYNKDYFKDKWDEAKNNSLGLSPLITTLTSGNYMLDRNMDGQIDYKDFAGIMNEPYYAGGVTRIVYKCSNSININKRHNLLHDGIKVYPTNETAIQALNDWYNEVEIATGDFKGVVTSDLLSSFRNVVQAFDDANVDIHCSIHPKFCRVKSTDKASKAVFCPLCVGMLNPEDESVDCLEWAGTYPSTCPETGCGALAKHTWNGNVIYDLVRDPNPETSDFLAFGGVSHASMEEETDKAFDFDDYLNFIKTDPLLGPDNDPIVNLSRNYNRQIVTYDESKDYAVYLPSNKKDQSNNYYYINANDYKSAFLRQNTNSDSKGNAIDIDNIEDDGKDGDKRKPLINEQQMDGTINIESDSGGIIKIEARDTSKDYYLDSDTATKPEKGGNYDMMVVSISKKNKETYANTLEAKKETLLEISGTTYLEVQNLWRKSTEYSASNTAPFNAFLKAEGTLKVKELNKDGEEEEVEWAISPEATGGVVKNDDYSYVSLEKDFDLYNGFLYKTVESKIFELKLHNQMNYKMNGYFDETKVKGESPELTLEKVDSDDSKGLMNVNSPNRMGFKIDENGKPTYIQATGTNDYNSTIASAAIDSDDEKSATADVQYGEYYGIKKGEEVDINAEDTYVLAQDVEIQAEQKNDNTENGYIKDPNGIAKKVDASTDSNYADDYYVEGQKPYNMHFDPEAGTFYERDEKGIIQQYQFKK